MQTKLFFTLLFSSLSLFSIECISLCNAEPECERDYFNTCCRITADAEFLYWTTEANALDYALEISQPYPQADCAVGTYKIATYDYDPAFRVGLRYYHANKYWEVYAQYTRFNNCGSNSVADDVLFITPTFLTNLSEPVIKATSNIDLCYNLLDFMVNRVFDPNPHLRIRALIGLTGVWVSQKWSINYTDTFLDQSSLDNKWTYRAIGYRTGAAFDWFWFWNIYMSGRATAALTVGKYVNTAQQQTDALPDPIASFRDSRFEDYRLATHIQLLFGPSYQCISPCWDFEIFAGYEFNAWSNLHEVFRCQEVDGGFESRTLINNGLLGMHGLTLRLTVAY